MPTFVPPGFKLPIEDIRDVQGWVRDRVARFFENGAEPTHDEFEEMCDQGILILLEVHRAWEPAKCAVFSKYAMSIFGKRLIDYWRREIASSGRGHTPQTKAGKRLATVYHGTVSLDAAHAPSPDVPGAHGTAASEPSAAHRFTQDRALTHFDSVTE